MKQFSLACLIVALMVALAAPAAADDKKKKKKGPKDPAAIAAVAKAIKDLKLTDEQQGKIKQLSQDYSGKIADAAKKSALTKEQQKARREAAQKAKADGKKGKDLRAAVNAALNLTEEQAAAFAAATKEVQTLAAEYRGKVREVLTEEQRAALPERGGKKAKGKKKGEAKKKKNKDAA